MTHRSALIFCLRCLAIIALVPGCHIVAGYKSSEPLGTDYECTTWILNCKKKPREPQPVVSAPQPSGTCYRPAPDLSSAPVWDGFKSGDQAYCDALWIASRIEPGELRDAGRILTRQADNEVDRQSFLSFAWPAEAKSLYVAYDSRAATKPGWLGPPDFRRVVDDNGLPRIVRITKPDAPGGIDLEVFERRFLSEPAPNDTVSLPSNQYGNPTWTGITPHQSAMYLVILEPWLDNNCENLGPERRLSPVITVGCFSTEQLAGGYAANDCDYERSSQTLTEQTCDEPVCVAKGSCPSDKTISELIGKRAFTSRSFLRSSEIEFDPVSSKAEITVDGSTFSQGVKGGLHFEYLADDFDRLHILDLNAMFLELGSLSSPIGTFADIEVGLSLPSRAHCLDQSPPWAKPCDNYRIDGGQFVAKQSAIHDGSDVVFVAQNARALDISIDHQTRGFRIRGGPLRTTLRVNDRDREVLTSIDLTGKFKNFEPHAVAEESTDVVECGVGDTLVPSNVQPVYLDSAGSFDVYESLAGASFDWYEDFGLATQTLWAQGAQATIAPYQLGLGAHEMTLVLRDSIGAMSTDSFWVEVRDRVPPALTVPPDRYFLLTGQAPVQIELGRASASDTCSKRPMIANDAPAGSMFPVGLTPVTWTADDGGGNVTTGIQKVYVFRMPDVSEPAVAVRGWADLVDSVAATAKKSMTAVETCPAPPCESGFRELAGQLELAQRALEALDMTGENARRRGLVVQRLEAVREQLLEADDGLDRSATAADEAAALRTGALRAAAASEESLREVGRMLRELAGEGDDE